MSPQSIARQIMSKYSTLADKKIKNRYTKVRNKLKDRAPIIGPRILIIDGTNMYLRRFSVHQYGHTKNVQFTNRAGQQTGGVYTMVLMLNKLINQLKRTHAFICWQGYHSKQNRRKVNQDYKANRVIKKSSSFVPQLKRVQRYIGMLPITQIKVDYTEADDIISMIVRQYPWHQKVIISQDQDFVQLINDQLKTKLFLSQKKLLLNQKKATEVYGCHPRNFVYMKAIMGDSSDNLKGIKGVGPKTIQKQVGKRLTQQTITCIQDLYKYSSQKFKSVLIRNKQILQNNLSIMSLHTNSRDMVSLRSMQSFKRQLQKPRALDNANLRIRMGYDGIYGQTTNKIVKTMYMLQYLKKKWPLKRRSCETIAEDCGKQEIASNERLIRDAPGLCQEATTNGQQLERRVGTMQRDQRLRCEDPKLAGNKVLGE